MAVFVFDSSTDSSKRSRSRGGRLSSGSAVIDFKTMEGHNNVSINKLQPHLSNTVVVGLVINKQSVHSFPDKRNPANIRYKMTFTIRDSADDYINVTCWGGESYVNILSQSFRIYDVVEIQNCQVSTKLESDDKWNPWTPSPFHLAVNEKYSSLRVCSGNNYAQFASLAYIPLRSHSDYYTLGDVLTNGQSLDGSLINILAVVGFVGSTQQITLKSGKSLHKCEVVVFDDACNFFELVIWDSEMINLAQMWIPKENIIFAVDVKVVFNSFKNTMSGTCISKTLITTNPDFSDAHRLYQYAQHVELDESHEYVQGIKEFFTIEQLVKFKNGLDDIYRPNVGITYAYLTLLNIDQDPSLVTTYRCLVCKFKVSQGASLCCNQLCPSLVSGDGFISELAFDLFISLADHTGTVDNVKLNGPVAAVDLLHKSPTEFLAMNEKDRIDLKASLLLERYKIWFKLNTIAVQQKTFIHVLKIESAIPNEVVTHMQSC